MCVATSDACFTPDSDRESGHPRKAMSALPPKADICSANTDVCYGPIADMACLLDHLVGAGEQRWRHRDSERLGSFEIDDKFVLAWGLYGQVGRLLTFEDTIDIARRLSELVLQV